VAIGGLLAVRRPQRRWLLLMQYHETETRGVVAPFHGTAPLVGISFAERFRWLIKQLLLGSIKKTYLSN